MSQSDLLRLKKITHILSEQYKLNSVLNSGDYSNYKGYAITRDVITNKILLNDLYVSNNNKVFDIDYKTKMCNDFNVCNNTNLRTNRVLSNNNGENRLNVMKPPNLSVWSLPSDKYICEKHINCFCENSVCICSFE